MPYKDKPAFRCKPCGHLHGAEAAGVEPTPASCPVCGKEDWEVLADCPPERLAELGLNDVAKHTPLSDEQDAAASLATATATRDALLAKKAHWEKNEVSIRAQYTAIADAHDAMAKKGPAGTRPKHFADHMDQLSKLKQEAQDMANLEFTQLDADNLTAAEAVIANGGKKVGTGKQHVTPHLIDRVLTSDKGG